MMAGVTTINWKIRVFPLFPLFFSLISLVHAETEVDLTQIPQNLADKLGIGLFGGQLLASSILLFMFLLPIALISRRKGHGWLAEMIVGFTVMGLCVAIGWMPYWILLLISLIIASIWSAKIKGWIT